MNSTDNKFLISVAPLTRIALTRDQSFFYLFSRSLTPGTLVEVPMGKRIVKGIVTKSSPDFPRHSNYQIKKVRYVVEESFLTQEQLDLAHYISHNCITPLGVTLKHFIPTQVKMRKSENTTSQHTRKKTLTTEAQDTIVKSLTKDRFESFFLHALSQSDKVGIIFSFTQKIIEKSSSQVLYLLPELIQTPYFTDFVHTFFPAHRIAVLHSNLSKGKFYSEWQKIKNGRASLIIGTRIAAFAPFHDLGAVIVDEAHDMAHKQWDHSPLYDTRIITQEIARLHNCVHIMTSATPRAVDYYAKDHKNTNMTFIEHDHHRKPVIEVIDMKKERWDKNKSPISRALLREITYTLKNNKQAILFVNRQGLSSFSVCSKCRKVLKCPECERALIATKKNTHICLKCNKVSRSSKKCDSCKAPMEHIGIGTEKIQKELQKIFINAKIAIVDGSTMKKKNAHKKIYEDFSQHKIDIIIGTQMITKKWHTNNIYLCAIIDTDHLLSNPDYLTNERTFAFVVNMALRTQNGKLIVQSFEPEHPVITHAKDLDFVAFYEEELMLRKILHFPPYTKIIKITYKNTIKKEVETTVDEVHDQLCTLCKGNDNINISEPYFPLIDKVRSQYRKQIIIKMHLNYIPDELHTFLAQLNIKWSIDVDPVQLS